MGASYHPEEVPFKKGLTGDDHAVVLIGINVSFWTTSSYVDSVGFFRGGNIFDSRKIRYLLFVNQFLSVVPPPKKISNF
jgi:hypothetical protein